MLHSVARMIQLAFEPGFDPFHSAFRILRQLEFRPRTEVPVARVKLLDVYVAEPRRCLDIRLSPGLLRKLKRPAQLAAACQPPTYGQRPSVNAFFNRMSPMQDAAIQTLVLQGFLEASEFDRDRLLRTGKPLEERLCARIIEVNNRQRDLMTFLLHDLEAISFNGSDGLKDRTTLGEFRYDLV